MEIELSILKERILASYEESYDLDVAFMKNAVSSDIASMLKRDTDFMYRIHYADAKLREKLIGTMVHSLDSEDEKLSHKAAIDLGNVLWPDKFKAKGEEKNQSLVPDSIILRGKKA